MKYEPDVVAPVTKLFINDKDDVILLDVVNATDPDIILFLYYRSPSNYIIIICTHKIVLSGNIITIRY